MATPTTSAESIYAGSGPYRRIWSQPGYWGVTMTIVLPGLNEVQMISAPPYDDVAYVYLGGWSSTLQAVDAGLQHSRLNGGEWSLVLLSARPGKHSLFIAHPNRFPAGATLELTFQVTAVNRLRVSARPIAGMPEGDVEERSIEWGDFGGGQDFVRKLGVQDIPRSAQEANLVVSGVAGWDFGGSQVLKRMVSIGQSDGNGGIDRFNSGSLLPNVISRDAKLIGSAGTVPWPVGHDDYHNYPANTAPKKYFFFQWADFNGETVTIDLR